MTGLMGSVIHRMSLSFIYFGYFVCCMFINLKLISNVIIIALLTFCKAKVYKIVSHVFCIVCIKISHAVIVINVIG